MPFEVKVRPLDSNASGEPGRYKLLTISDTKVRFKRLFERQNSGIRKDGFEPNTVCLVNMVQNYMEDRNEKQTCIGIHSSDDEFDPYSCFGDSDHSSANACQSLKSLVPCQTVLERNLLADTAKIVDQKKITKKTDDVCLNIVTNGLTALGYDASVCKTHWEKSSTCPAGEYEYVDVVLGGERLIVDIDFRSEFEIARATKSYKSILLTLPVIFVGKSDRLQKITSIVTEAVKQSLKKKGMPLPPWRKSEYVKAKWLSAYTRVTPTGDLTHETMNANAELPDESSDGTLGEESSGIVIKGNAGDGLLLANSFDKNEKQGTVTKMEQPEISFKNRQNGVKRIGGLTCIIDDSP